MLNAELLAEEEAKRSEEAEKREGTKAKEETPKENGGLPRAAEEKPDAGGEAAGRELEALRVRAAELDDRLRRKGLRKAERAKISEELSGVQARMQELSGGNLVLFSRGDGAQGRPALSPTKAALRDRLLLKIAQTAGIRIVRERSAQILGSARNAEVRRRLGGYMGKAWSARANGLRYSLEEAFPATAEERDGIEREAKANGTWLKAPNGQDTKLTPKQWVTVRTRAFKKWFGDWEKSATLANSFREEDSNANIIRVERDGYTDEFRGIQAESNRLLPEDISSLHRRDRRLSEDRRKSLAGAYGRLLNSGSRVGRSVWTHLTGKGNTFRIARVNGELFHDIFEVNRKYLPNGELVDLHEDYSNAKCFLTDDGMCGFAVEEGGNLISVFSLNPNNAKERQGFLHAIKDFAREQGATHLDAYASNKQPLDEIYAKTLGFHVAAEMDYAMEYDHDDIAANHGKPKVVFMVDSAAAERRKFDDYDAAVAYQRGATSAANAASKVVDENGEPLVVWHGSPSDFNEFSLRYLGTNGTAEGYGFYFTDRRAVAESYARGTEAQRHQGANGRLFEVFLNIAKPLSNERVTMTREEFRRFLRELNRQTDADGNPLELLSNYGDAAYEGAEAVMNEAERLEYDGNDNDVDIVHSIINAVGDKERVFRVLRSTTGFDGIVADNPKWGGDQTVYVAFNPTQIKSATENVGRSTRATRTFGIPFRWRSRRRGTRCWTRTRRGG